MVDTNIDAAAVRAERQIVKNGMQEVLKSFFYSFYCDKENKFSSYAFLSYEY